MTEDEVEEYKHELVDHNKELVTRKKLEEDLGKDSERMCVECDKLNNKSAHVEARHDALVEKLKNKLHSVIFEQKEEEHVEPETQRNK